MIKLITFAAVALAVTTSVKAMPVAPVHEPDGMITHSRLRMSDRSGRGFKDVRVDGIYRSPDTRITADVHDGMKAFAALVTTTGANELTNNTRSERHARCKLFARSSSS